MGLVCCGLWLFPGPLSQALERAHCLPASLTGRETEGDPQWASTQHRGAVQPRGWEAVESGCFRAPALPLTGRENLGNLFDLSFLICKVGILISRVLVGIREDKACYST